MAVDHNLAFWMPLDTIMPGLCRPCSPPTQLYSTRSCLRELASGMRQLAGTKTRYYEGSRHSARWTHIWPRGVPQGASPGLCHAAHRQNRTRHFQHGNHPHGEFKCGN